MSGGGCLSASGNLDSIHFLNSSFVSCQAGGFGGAINTLIYPDSVGCL
jgi:hypothetical protein